MPLVHHEQCFGCGRTNLFGLLAELEQTGPHAVGGRCFIKQDHQGTNPGSAHEGVVAAALAEALAFAAGPTARMQRLEIELSGAVPVGSFLEVAARASTASTSATASVDGKQVASGSATFSGP
jgi:hypothetical protein